MSLPMFNRSLYILTFAAIIISMYPYYRKVSDIIELQIFGANLKQCRKLIPTYATLGRFLGFIFLFYIGLGDLTLRYVCVLYGGYILTLLYWSGKKSYHDTQYKPLRAIADFWIAFAICLLYGGINSAAPLLFFIPLTSMARNYPRMICVGFLVLTLGAMIAINNYGMVCYQWLNIDKLHEYFMINGGAGEIFLPENNINNLIIYMVTVLLVTSILYIERRETFFPRLAALYDFHLNNKIDIKKFLSILNKQLNCHLSMIITDAKIYFMFHEKAGIHSDSAPSNPTQLYGEAESGSFDNIVDYLETLDLHRHPYEDFYLYHKKYFNSLIKLLKDAYGVPNTIRDSELETVAATKIDDSMFVVSFNQYARNRRSVQRFSRVSLFQLHLYAGYFKGKK